MWETNLWVSGRHSGKAQFDNNAIHANLSLAMLGGLSGQFPRLPDKRCNLFRAVLEDLSYSGSAKARQQCLRPYWTVLNCTGPYRNHITLLISAPTDYQGLTKVPLIDLASITGS